MAHHPFFEHMVQTAEIIHSKTSTKLQKNCAKIGPATALLATEVSTIII